MRTFSSKYLWAHQTRHACINGTGAADKEGADTHNGEANGSIASIVGAAHVLDNVKPMFLGNEICVHGELAPYLGFIANYSYVTPLQSKEFQVQ